MQTQDLLQLLKLSTSEAQIRGKCDPAVKYRRSLTSVCTQTVTQASRWRPVLTTWLPSHLADIFKRATFQWETEVEKNVYSLPNTGLAYFVFY